MSLVRTKILYSPQLLSWHKKCIQILFYDVRKGDGGGKRQKFVSTTDLATSVRASTHAIFSQIIFLISFPSKFGTMAQDNDQSRASHNQVWRKIRRCTVVPSSCPHHTPIPNMGKIVSFFCAPTKKIYIIRWENEGVSIFFARLQILAGITRGSESRLLNFLFAQWGVTEGRCVCARIIIYSRRRHPTSRADAADNGVPTIITPFLLLFLLSEPQN